MTVKFNTKARTIYAVARKAQGVSVTIPSTETMGTVTTTVGSATVTGTLTTFLTQATQNAYLYTDTGYEIGQIKTINSDTSITLYEPVPAAQVENSAETTPVATAVTSSAYAFGLGNANAIAILEPTITTNTSTNSVVYSGNEFDRDEETWVIDQFVDLGFTTFMPALGEVSRTVAALDGTNTIKLELGSTHRVVGIGTTFLTTLDIGSFLYTSAGVFIGIVKEIWSNTILELAYPAENLSNNAITYKYSNTITTVGISAVNIPDVFQAVGLGIELGSGYVKFSNSLPSSVYLEVESRLSSSEYPANSYLEKRYLLGDVRGTVDLELTAVGQRVRLMPKLQGNLLAIEDVQRRIPNYGTQKTKPAETVNSNTSLDGNVKLVALQPHYPVAYVTFPTSIASGATIIIAGLTFTASATVTKAELIAIWSGIPVGTTSAAANALKATELSGKGTFSGTALVGYSTTYYQDALTYVRFVGSSMTASPESLVIGGTATAQPVVVPDPKLAAIRPNASNICIDKLTAPNASGFELARFRMTCEDGWSRNSIASDVTMGVLEDRALATYNPYDFLAVRHLGVLNWGFAETGRNVDLEFTALMLTKTTDASIANFKSFDYNLRSVGQFAITLWS
jgi:hypothetical protein